MEYLGLVFILYFAYVGDFKLQSRKIALTKSTEIEALAYHVLILTGVLFFPAFIVFALKYSFFAGLIMSGFFCTINGVIHGVIDWNIWRGYKKHVKNNPEIYFGEGSSLSDWEKAQVFAESKLYAEDKEFYDTIGFDGYLHVATIVLLYGWIMA